MREDISIHVITLSDRAALGTYEDKSGPAVVEMLKDYFKGKNISCAPGHTIIPDDRSELAKLVASLVMQHTDIIITTGGTGVGERDITPETLSPMFEKEIPGIMDFIRITYGARNPNALISRSVAGVIGKTQVYALPGSVRAVREYLGEILKIVEHIFDMLYGVDSHERNVPGTE